MSDIALVALTEGGLRTARRLAEALPGARVHGRAGRAADGAQVVFDDTTGHLRALFAAGTTVVGLCAAGILVRAVAPLLADKRAEPPVLAVAEDGSAVVPLLGGHRGANRLAAEIAAVLGVAPALTTAGDAVLGLALDDPPSGWRVANPEQAKPVAAALLSGQPVRLNVDCGDAAWLTAGGAPFADEGALAVRVSDHVPAENDGETLVLHPPVLALGVGCERGTPPDELAAHVREVLDTARLSAQAVACVCSLDVKMDEPAVLDLARALGVPARFFTAAELEAQAPRLVTPSEAVFAEVGCHGVAEGAALAAAGPDGALVVPKAKGARTTVALARAPGGIDVAAVGRARGRLAVVGVGPGSAGWRSPEVSRLLAEADDVVGYRLYLDLVADAVAGKRVHESPMTQEEARVRQALSLAAEGKSVALVCSGDAGIYALAALVFEVIEEDADPAFNRIEVVVSPGISALQAAAARAGAPIGHDFCTVSLSDLLTPWEAIEQRLEAAARGDFVVALYNPVSKRRRTQLVAAREALLAHRPPETPVILARSLGRPDETVRFTTLDRLSPDDADMLTVVVVGNRQTRRFAAGGREWVYTPRGYAAKRHRLTQE